MIIDISALSREQFQKELHRNDPNVGYVINKNWLKTRNETNYLIPPYSGK